MHETRIRYNMAQNRVTWNAQCFACIRLCTILSHVKSNTLLLKDDVMTPTVTPTAMPISAHIRIYTNCNANHSSYWILHDFGPSKIEHMAHLGWLGVTNSHTDCSANSTPYLCARTQQRFERFASIVDAQAPFAVVELVLSPSS